MGGAAGGLRAAADRSVGSVLPEEAMHRSRDGVCWSVGVDDKHSAAHPPKHEGSVQAGGPAPTIRTSYSLDSAIWFILPSSGESGRAR